jgi:hypothetical protein
MGHVEVRASNYAGQRGHKSRYDPRPALAHRRALLLLCFIHLSCKFSSRRFSPVFPGSGRDRGVTEHELVEQVLGQLRESSGLVLASFSPLHVDRLVTFYKATRHAGRTFVVDPYGAFVMHLVSGQCHIPRPTEAAGIRVFYNAYFEASYQRRNLGKIHRLFAADRIELADNCLSSR